MDPSYGESRDGRDASRRHIIEYVCKRPVIFESKFEGVWKRDMAAEMPKELVEMCWWCRRPVGGRACGMCKTCRGMKLEEGETEGENG
jgi:hypothetical protein